MTWWLSASPEQLRAARTCRVCGCGDADIDLGLCYGCFSVQREHDEMQRDVEREHSRAIEREYEREMTGRLYEHMEGVLLHGDPEPAA